MKNILTLIFLIQFQISIMAQDRPTLIYFGDPMCSWCYGFSPEFSETVDALKSDVEVEYIMGGLRPYGKQTMSELGDFLHHHWEEVGERSGQKFNYGILENKEFTYDTEPACRAVVTMRALKPEKEFEFFKAVQLAFYYENKNTNDLGIYPEIAAQFGVDKKTFSDKFNSEEMKNKVRNDFTRSGEMGVRGFPTVALKKGEEYFLITNGYDTSENLVKKINGLIK